MADAVANVLKTTVKADPLKITREVAAELNIDYSTVSHHSKLIGKVKKLDKWMLYDLSEAQKYHCYNT